jgi:hypothetical protein
VECPKCQKPIEIDCKVCPACGEKLPQRTPCPHCGERLDGKWNVCPFCGLALSEDFHGQGDISVQDSVVKEIRRTTNISHTSSNIGQQFLGPVSIKVQGASSEQQTAQNAISKGIQLLELGQATNAAKFFRDALEADPLDNNANLFLGIALLSQQHISHMKHSQIREAETALKIAMSDQSTCQACLYSLAAIRHCFYMDHSMREPSPSFAEAKKLATKARPMTDRQERLLSGLKTCQSFAIDWCL